MFQRGRALFVIGILQAVVCRSSFAGSSWAEVEAAVQYAYSVYNRRLPIQVQRALLSFRTDVAGAEALFFQAAKMADLHEILPPNDPSGLRLLSHFGSFERPVTFAMVRAFADYHGNPAQPLFEAGKVYRIPTFHAASIDPEPISHIASGLARRWPGKVIRATLEVPAGMGVRYGKQTFPPYQYLTPNLLDSVPRGALRDFVYPHGPIVDFHDIFPCQVILAPCNIEVVGDMGIIAVNHPNGFEGSMELRFQRWKWVN